MSNHSGCLGDQYGRLTLKSYISRGKWTAACSCGNEIIAPYSKLIIGRVKSCGCLRREKNLSHGHSSKENKRRTLTYSSWVKMIAVMRCNTHPNYKGDQFDMDPRWRDFTTFLQDMGRERKNIECLARKDFGYGFWPDNCFWEEVSNNRLRSAKFRWRGT